MGSAKDLEHQESEYGRQSSRKLLRRDENWQFIGFLSNTVKIQLIYVINKILQSFAGNLKSGM